MNETLYILKHNYFGRKFITNSNREEFLSDIVNIIISPINGKQPEDIKFSKINCSYHFLLEFGNKIYDEDNKEHFESIDKIKNDQYRENLKEYNPIPYKINFDTREVTDCKTMKKYTTHEIFKEFVKNQIKTLI